MPTIEVIYKQVFKFWRQKRFRQFLSLIQPKSTDRLIDVGGHPRTWLGEANRVESIELINVDTDFEIPKASNISSTYADACHLPHSDQSFDIAYSNSVIEHVGSLERQAEFAAEIRRVGKRLWVQTPAYECFIEPHFMLPFVHWLPMGFRKFFIWNFSPWPWMERPDRDHFNSVVESTRLLSRKELEELFPDCTIHTERMLGIFVKSYIAVRTCFVETTSPLQETTPSQETTQVPPPEPASGN